MSKTYYLCDFPYGYYPYGYYVLRPLVNTKWETHMHHDIPNSWLDIASINSLQWKEKEQTYLAIWIQLLVIS